VPPSGPTEDNPSLNRSLISELRRILGPALSLRTEDRICYSYDATDLRSLPQAVVWPSETSEVAAVLRAAGEAGVPVVPRGAGTGYTGGSIPLSGGIVMSFEKMASIVSIDAGRRMAVVEPGVVNNTLREEAEALGLCYPPDPASLLVSTLGGNVAEGAGGPRTVLHGATRDYVVGLELVMPDGTVCRTGVLAGTGAAGTERPWDASPLIVASEGTLAVVTRIAFRLSDAPESFATFWAEFSSLEQAAGAVAAITARGLPVSVLEILDRETLACATEYVRGRRPDDPPEGALLIELEGAASQVREGSASLRRELSACGATALREAADESERDEIWEMRRAISPSLARLSTGKINEDIAVPRSAIPDFVREMRRISDDSGLPILAFGHAGDGNLHVNIMLDRSSAREMKEAREAVGRLFDAALSMGGTLSGEHGIGITKADHLSRELDDVALGATAALKRALDPGGLLNPDKILTRRPNPWWESIGDEDATEAPEC
jgi:glycolate oxidase